MVSRLRTAVIDCARCAISGLLCALVLSATHAWSAEPWFVRFINSDAELPPAPAAEEEPANPTVHITTESPGPLITLEGPGAEEARLTPEKVDEAKDADDDRQFSALMFSYVPGGGDQLGMFTVESRGIPQDPFPEAALMTAQPGWAITWLSGPQSTDLPPQLYQLGINLGTVWKIDDDWSADVGISPFWFTDFENRRPEAFRLMGRAAMFYRIDDDIQIAGGFVYLNRDDIPALPVAGLILRGRNHNSRYELVFPRPKLSWRVSETEKSTRWLTLTGELGGGSWAIKREDRTPDVLTYRDLRLTGGMEFRKKDGGFAAVEAGYLFDRQIETRTGRGDYSPSDAFLLRLVLAY